ncbi:sensor histidine kinase [Rummeliibacillus sp. POC4]|uniref:ATP-binding protein n=1 Tax=Rummeliibacillus sp. POC4 TaxID=2305899 RepID=UPI000E6628B9|nr:sensor histidine kinase [Rummeliibacillus sp. POC4]RIJ64545.1 sensor histidine kinase [Rummeliibacillus sp. POC4]
MNGKIMSLTFFIIVFSFLVAGIFVIGNILSTKEKELGNQAMLIARTVAKLPEIQHELLSDKKPQEQAKTINETIEGIRIINKADYIVVLNMDHIRLSHPVKDLIGKKSKTNDENAAFTEHYYLSKAKGEVGTTIRAFVPIMDAKHKQIGVVIVGYNLPSIFEILYGIRKEILVATLLSLLFGAWGAWILGRNMKKQMFDLEPHEIAKMYTERTETFNAMHEGIITIDNEFTVTIFNTKAKQILGVTEDNLVGKKIYDILPDTRLPEILDYNIPIYNKELLINQHTIMSNRVPIEVDGKTVGAIAIFQDRTEVKKLAEELTGVKEFVQALRIQNHEHKNKIHTIAGLLQLGHYQQALNYIEEVKDKQEEIANFLNDRIKNQNISGLLLSKINHGKELGISVEIDMNSQLTYLPEQLDFNDFVVIIGNLIENAFDALQLAKKDEKKVMISIDQDDETLSVLVEDNGVGMSQEVIERIFDNGYTTKRNENHGIGLYLIQDIVKKFDGTIDVTSTPGEGTSIYVTFYV